jgi:hypothetical protein
MPIIPFFRFTQFDTRVMLVVMKLSHESQFKPTIVFLLCIFIP